MGATTKDCVDITRDNFKQMLPLVQQKLKECTFYALDCEMTGLFVDGIKEEFLDDCSDRYWKLKESSHAYIINQFGLSCFKATSSSRLGGSGTCFEASTFNFYIFPEPLKDSNQNRKFLSDSGSLSFLASQNFDFNKWIYKGVPFMPSREAQKKIQDAKRYYNNGEVRNNPIIPNKLEDIAFVESLVKQVKDWMAGDDPEVLLQEMNSYRRLLAFQELEKPQFGSKDYPGFFVKKVDTNNGYAHLMLIRGSQAEVKALQEEDVKQRVEVIEAAAGFTRVLEAMRDSKRPAVGHNCSFDIAYVLAACAEPRLPPSWSEYKKLVGEWFPGGVYDTKYLSRQLPEVFDGWTALGDVFKAVTQEGEKKEKAKSLLTDVPGQPSLSLSHVTHAAGFEKYATVEAGECAHEAGYDAYMTGVAFANLLPLMLAKDAKLAATTGSPSGSTSAELAALALNSPLKNGGAAKPWSGDGSTMQLDDDEDFKAATAADQSSLILAPVMPYRSRLNVMRTDMPYAVLEGPDPPLLRPNVFHVSGLPGGGRVDEIVRLFQTAELGRPRITFVGPPGSGAGALVEVDAAFAGDVLFKLMGAPKPVQPGGAWPSGEQEAATITNGTLRVITWAQYATQKAAAAAATVADQRPNKRSRNDVNGSVAANAAAASAGMRLSQGVVPVSHKGGRCSIM